ncbi:MAG TPA: DUF2752 domain-containing protein [Chitinophagales bacterium]|nr:DUF2752 domain-containing protein [Chitinophagales bacterium]
MATTLQRSDSSSTLNKLARIIWLTCLIIAPIVLLLLPSTYFDKGHSICLVTLVTGQECYGCGMTRSIMHMIHFDFSTAWNYNKIAFIAFPILCVLYLEMIVRNMFLLGIIRNGKIIQLFDKLYPKKKTR